jgi:alpha-tubulin suppressor-like RCC1 family protein
MQGQTRWMLAVSLASCVVMVMLSAGCSSGGTKQQPGYLVRVQNEDPGDRCTFGGKRITTGQDADSDGVLSNAEATNTDFICNGSAGAVGIVQVADEPAGANCAAGGKRIESWLDANQNEVVDEGEILSTSYICDGTDTTNELKSLARLADEGPGANCQSGGQRLELGIDRNGNDLLDDAEVTSSSYLCNLESVGALINVAAEPAGANCATGGQKFDAGLDSNKNATLDPEEVTATEYLCNSVPLAVRMIPEPEDPYTCLRGGTRIESGTDLNADGDLADAEVQKSSTVCNPYPLYPLSVSAGHRHTCALLSNNTVQCWGEGGFGQLGDGQSGLTRNSNLLESTYSSPDPVRVPTITSAVQVVTGGAHSCARLRDGTAYCWGSNIYGQLGNGAGQGNAAPADVFILPEAPDPFIDPVFEARPVAVALTGVTDIDAGLLHTCAVSGGQVHCWGGNFHGQLGNDADAVMDPMPVPTAVAGLTDIVDVTCGDMHTCALKSDGQVFCWGANASGQLGNGTLVKQLTPVQVQNASAGKQIDAGLTHTCMLRNDGDMFCWGANGNGQVGNGTLITQNRPVDVNNISQGRAIIAGLTHTCAVLDAGSVHCWGSNGFGQLGDGATAGTNQQNAVRVNTQTIHPEQLERGLAVTAGGDVLVGHVAADGLISSVVPGAQAHSCMIDSRGVLYCWGSNVSGQLGDSSTNNSNTPSLVNLILEP